MIYSTTYARTIDFTINDCEVEAEAVFDVECETYPAEPYSWGNSRGTETDVRAELVSVQLGGFKADRSTFEAMAGAASLAAIETAAREGYAELVALGEVA